MNGSGTENSPYLIKTAEDFDNVRNDLSAHYILGNDIDFSSWGNFKPIGTFTGKFDGNGHVISNLTISTTATRAGIFERLHNRGSIKKLGVKDIDVKGKNDAHSVGGLVAETLSNTIVERCFIIGKVNGGQYSGGLIGRNSAYVINCYSQCHLGNNGTVIGGLLGRIVTGHIAYNYSASTVPSGTRRGSFYGSIVANSSATYANNFLDGTIGYGNTGGSAIKSVSTTSMQTQSTYPSTWDFDTVWQMEKGEYPTLQAFNQKGVQETINLSSQLSVTSHLKRSKRKLQASVTYTHPIASSVYKQATMYAETMIDEIVSSVEVKQNANIKTYEITSDIEEFESSMFRKVRATKIVNSDIQLQITTDIIIPNEVEKPIYANAYIAENQSNVKAISSQTSVQAIENATEMSVI